MMVASSSLGQLFSLRQDDLADMRAFFHKRMGLGGLGQWESGVDQRFDPARIQQGPDLFLQRGGNPGLFGDGAGPQRRACQRQSFQHHGHEVHFRRRAIEESDGDDASVAGRRLDVARDIVATHHVEDDVDAALFCQCLHLGDKILRFIVDGGFRAEFEAGGTFLGRSGGHEDARAEDMGELDRGRANAAGAAMYEQAFAAFQRASLKYIGPDREKGFGQTRSLYDIKSTRHRQGVAFVRDTIFGIAAAAYQRADRVADLPLADIGAQRDHGSGDFKAGRIGAARRGRVKAHALDRVRAVDAGGLDLDQDFVGAGCRRGDFVQLQHFRSARSGDGDGFHRGG